MIKNILKSRDMNIGFAARSVINDLKKKDAVTSTELTHFFSEVLFCITSTLEKLFKKSPLSSIVVLHASVFNPSYVLEKESDVLYNKIKKLLTHLLK